VRSTNKYLRLVVCVCSYSYDLTHSLQFNMAACNLPTATSPGDADRSSSECAFWQTDAGADRVVHDSAHAEHDVEDASSVLQADLFTDDDMAATSGVVASAADNCDQSGSKRGSNSGLQDSANSTEGNTLL